MTTQIEPTPSPEEAAAIAAALAVLEAEAKARADKETPVVGSLWQQGPTMPAGPRRPLGWGDWWR